MIVSQVRPLVVRGAGAAGRSGFPIPLSIRTCGFPAYGLPMIFCAWLRCPRIADGAAEPVQAVPVEPFFCPCPGLASVQVPAPLGDHQAAEAEHDVNVGLAELAGGVPGAEVVAPARSTGFRSATMSRMSHPARLRPVRSRDDEPDRKQIARQLAGLADRERVWGRDAGIKTGDRSNKRPQ
jgi:hypothetical protein